jgi:hypothetical protein
MTFCGGSRGHSAHMGPQAEAHLTYLDRAKKERKHHDDHEAKIVTSEIGDAHRKKRDDADIGIMTGEKDINLMAVT